MASANIELVVGFIGCSGIAGCEDGTTVCSLQFTVDYNYDDGDDE